MKSASNKEFLLKCIVTFIDWVTFNIALLVCFIMNWWPYTDEHVVLFADWAIANLSYVILQFFVPIVLYKRGVNPATIMRNAARSSILLVILNAAILGMSHMMVPGFFRSLTVMAIVMALTVAERLMLRRFIKQFRHVGKNNMNAIIIGYGYMAQKVVDTMEDNWNGYNLVGVFSNKIKDGKLRLAEPLDSPLATIKGEKLLGSLDDVYTWLEHHEIDEVFIAMGNEYDQWLVPILKLCEHRMIKVFYIPQSHSTAERRTRTVEFGDTFVMAQYNEPLLSVTQRIKKRSMDVIVSVIFLCLFFPWIYLIVALITRFTMPGPIFFKQKRTGYDGKEYWVYKFRSMKVNGDSDKVQATKEDPRITRWGHFMRHTNIDELPQFINVLRGEMSIVGPRPHMLAHTDYYSARIGDYMIRHYVKPGITGWAQTHGYRGETRTVEDMAHRVELDIWYIEHWSFWLDISIIMKTIQNIFVGDEQAY